MDKDLELLIIYTYWLCKEGKDGVLGYKGNNEKFSEQFIQSDEYKQFIITINQFK